jgi:hypothetical protein
MSATSELITQDELNAMIGRRVYLTLKEGRVVPFTKGMQVPYTEPGFRASTWDVIKHPNNFGSILRVGFVDNGNESDPSAELKFVFLMEMK